MVIKVPGRLEVAAVGIAIKEQKWYTFALSALVFMKVIKDLLSGLNMLI